MIGHQKSGTTAVGQLLSSMAGLSYSSDPFYHIDSGTGSCVEKIMDKPSGLKALVCSNEALFSQQAIKDPDLTFIANEAKSVYSKARFLHIVRDARYVIRSIAERLRLTREQLEQEANIVALPNRHWRLILEGSLPSVQGTSIAEVLARRWRLAIQPLLHDRAIVECIRYEDFLVDKLGVLHKTAHALGLPYCNDISQMLDVQFQPKSNSSKNLKERLGVKNLSRIEEICGTELARMGYS